MMSPSRLEPSSPDSALSTHPTLAALTAARHSALVPDARGRHDLAHRSYAGSRAGWSNGDRIRFAGSRRDRRGPATPTRWQPGSGRGIDGQARADAVFDWGHAADPPAHEWELAPVPAGHPLAEAGPPGPSDAGNGWRDSGVLQRTCGGD